jgi:tetratricopeptide (TPR) repeat protein
LSDRLQLDGRGSIFPDTQSGASGSQQAHPDSKTITIQQLSHKVPGKARKEMVKAEKARLGNQADQAIVHYKTAISIDPEFVAARNNLALVYLTHSNLTPAVDELHEAIKVDPHNAILFRNLAIGFILGRHLDDAERAARQAVDLDRVGPQARILLGIVLLEQRKFTAEALQCFVRTSSEFPVAHLLAGRVLVAQGDSEQAKSEVRAYLASGDKDSRTLATEWLNILDHGETNLAAITTH